MKNKLVLAFAFLIVGIFLFSFVSSAELKLIKVSELKQGDIMVDKNGNEIIVQNITAQSTTTKTIGEIINEKLFGKTNTNNAVVENSVKITDKQVILAAGNKKVGIVNAYAVYNTPEQTHSKMSLVLALTIQKIKSIISFGRW